MSPTNVLYTAHFTAVPTHTRLPPVSRLLHKMDAPTTARILLAAAVAFAIGLAFPRHATAEEPASIAKPDAKSPPPTPPAVPTPEDIRRWINELGHDSYIVRQKASEQLLAAGMIARQPLIDIAEGTDPETRASARRLVSLIDRSEFRHRLDAFAADTDGRQGLTLPGWEEYQKLVGHDPTDRALFVEIQRQEGSLLAAVFGISKRTPEELWEARLQQLASWQATVNDRASTPPLGSCAAMFFLGAAGDLNVSDTAVLTMESLIQRPPVREMLQNDESHAAFRKLLVTWAVHCPNKNDIALRCRLNLIANARLTEALPLALAVASGEPDYARVPSPLRAAAALVVGQLGKREHADRLEPLLKDTSVCSQVQPQARAGRS